MSAGLTDRYNDTQDEDFRRRVLIAMVEAANGNVGETVASPGIAGDKRTAFARSVIANPLAHLDAVMYSVVADGTDETSTDAEIRTRLGDLWNALSGVRGGE